MNLTDSELKFLTAMREAVLVKGQDYVYDSSETGELERYSCTYLNYKDAPSFGSSKFNENIESLPGSCIVGCALVGSGLSDRATLFEMEGYGARRVLSNIGLGKDFSSVVDYAQSLQDTKKNWGHTYSSLLTELNWRGYSVPDSLKI